MNPWERKQLTALSMRIAGFKASRRALDEECKTPEPLPDNPHRLQVSAHSDQTRKATSFERLKVDLRRSHANDPYYELLECFDALVVECFRSQGSEILKPTSQFGQALKSAYQQLNQTHRFRRAFKAGVEGARWLRSFDSDSYVMTSIPIEQFFAWTSPGTPTGEEAKGYGEICRHVETANEALAGRVRKHEALLMPLLDALNSLVEKLLLVA